MPLHYSPASLRQSTIPIGANVHGRPPASAVPTSAVPTCLAKECLSATLLNFCVVRAKHLAQIVGTALDDTLRAKLRNPVCIVPENLAVDALIVLSQTRRRLIELGLGIRKTYRQSHGANAINPAVLRMEHRDRFFAGHNSRIVNGNRGITHFSGGNSGGVQFSDRFGGGFGARPLPDQRVEFAIVLDARIARAEALVLNQFGAAHNLEQMMRKTIGIGANRDVPVLRGINPKRGEPLHGLAGAYWRAALFHRLIGFAGDQSRQSAEHRDIDVLSGASPASLMKRGEHTDNAKQSSR